MLKHVFIVSILIASCAGRDKIIKHFDKKHKSIIKKYGHSNTSDTNIIVKGMKLYYADSVLYSYETKYQLKTYIIELMELQIENICVKDSDSTCFPLVLRNTNW